MKIVDIVPGAFYALPANKVSGFGGWQSRGGRTPARGTAAHVSEGMHAAPCKVVAVGKFRRRQSGVCAHEIVEDHYATTVRVQVVDVDATFGDRGNTPIDDRRVGFPDGLKLNSKKITWVERVVKPSQIIMPWSDFLKRRAERLFVETEVTAFQVRLEELRSDLKDFIIDNVLGTMIDYDDVRVLLGSRRDGRLRLHYRADGATHMKIETSHFLPIPEATKSIVREMADIESRISCRR